MTEKEILSKIETYMRKNKLRQWELAAKLGIPEATFSRWMTRRRNISRAYLKILQKEGII